jgi:hypothetical protein
MMDAVLALPGGLALLVTKMAVTAAFVVVASLIAERTTPLIAAMIATLPVSAGPVYAFLALEHDDAFIAASALSSTSGNVGTAALILAYVMAAQNLRTGLSLMLGFLAYLPAVLLFRWLDLSAASVGIMTLTLFPVAHLAIRRWMDAVPMARPAPPWFALPLRAMAVAIVVAIVTSISFSVGPVWSGLLAPFPIVMSSLIVILQPRIGGPATAAILASAILGLMGFSYGLLAVHLAVPSAGKWGGLIVGLLVCITWNLVLAAYARRRASP